MSGMIVLFVISLVEGYLLGYFSIHLFALGFSGIALALATAWFLQARGFWIAGGIAIIVGCITLNQLAFLLGALVRMSRERNRDE